MNINSKLPDVGKTIFAEMSALAQEHEAINLSQGFPDFNTPEDLIDRVTHHMEIGHNQYPPMPGLPELKEKLSRKLEHLYGFRYSPDSEITVTAGATQALHMSITALIHEGDEVILFEPAYDIYAPCVKMNQGTPRQIKMTPPNYSISWQKVEEYVNDNTRLIILNTPHNPTGRILKQDDLQRLTALAEQYDLYILSDEVYQHMVYDGNEHQSICRYPALRKRGIATFSFGKTYHATGWKVGYFVAPEPLTEEIRKIFQYGMFAVSSPMQYALADYLDYKKHYLELSEFYQRKRDLFRDIIKTTRFKLMPCEGTYYQCVDFSEISDKPDFEYVKELIRDHGVAAIPVSPFYTDGHDASIIRFCFAKKRETLEKAGELLAGI